MANHGPSYGLSRELEKKVRIQSKSELLRLQCDFGPDFQSNRFIENG